MMNRLIASVYVALAIVFATSACDRWDQRLVLVNKRRVDTLYLTISMDDRFDRHPVWIERGDTVWTHIRYLAPGDSIRPLSIEGITWRDQINEHCKDSTLSIFVFENTLLKVVRRDSLVAKQIYSKKITMKVRELDRLNWRLELN